MCCKNTTLIKNFNIKNGFIARIVLKLIGIVCLLLIIKNKV